MQASPQQIDQTCGLGKGVNLLDNAWWARSKAIINQRGQTSYTGSGYGIDRFKFYGGDSTSKVEILDRGLRLSGNGYYCQSLSTSLLIPGGTYTLSILAADNKMPSRNLYIWVNGMGDIAVGPSPLTVTIPTNIPADAEVRVYVAILNAPIVLLAFKLEEGTEQTLAVQNPDGSWVLAEPAPNYALELLKCQRYLRSFGGTGGIYLVGWLNQGRSAIHIPYPPVIEMRVPPTLVVIGGDTNTYLNGITIDGNGKRVSMGTGSFTGISFDQRDSRVSLSLSSSGKNLVSSLASHVIAVWTSTATNRMFMSAEP